MKSLTKFKAILSISACVLAGHSALADIIQYDYQGTFTSGSLTGQTLTGFVDIDTDVAIANTYLSTNTPATLGISGAITGWQYTIGAETFNQTTAHTNTHNLYYLASVVSLPTTMTEWYIDILLNSNGDHLQLGTQTFGGTTMVLSGSSGNGSFTLGTFSVPEGGATVAMFGGVILGLAALRRKFARA